MKPRILQLIDSFDEGGSERQAIQLTRLLHESGKYDVALASLKPSGALRGDVEELGLGSIRSYPLTSFYDRNALRQLRSFMRHLQAEKIELLHTHDFYTNIFGMAAGRLAGVKVRIASCRETGGMRSSAQLKAQRVAYALAHKVMTNSEAVCRRLLEEGVAAEKIVVIHNGPELARVHSPGEMARAQALEALGIREPASTIQHFVTIVANMRHDVKNHPMFLRAAQQITESVPNVGFLLAGEGELRDELQQLASDLGIEAKTFFLGRCHALAHLLQVSDVCVLSSKAEGFSNSILEYMAAGRPVVATDVGGAREVIVEGETGHLVPSGDDRLMAERIVALLLNPGKARQMGDKGKQVIEEKFSARALLQKTAALYDTLLQQKQKVGVVSDIEAEPVGAGTGLRMQSGTNHQ